MLDEKIKEEVRNIIHNLNRKLLLLEGEECPEERRLIINSIILNDNKGSELNQLKDLLEIKD
ncbi:MAG: hypothetical protein ACTSUO_08555 [Candidatus Thorarchaeota archaeon]